MYRSLVLLPGLLFVLSIPQHGYAFQDTGPQTPTPEEIEAAENAPLFASRDVFEITLETDFSEMKKRDRVQDAEERPGRISWIDASGAEQSMEVQFSTRGNFRLERRNCEFPPIRLNLKQGATKGTIFETQDKLKVVGSCKLGQDYWEQYVLKEYLVYRTLNLLTDVSFRVRLVRATYVDIGGEDDSFTRYAFLIEDDDAMALRNGGRKVEWTSGQLNPMLLEHHSAILVDIFQYMIGNTDWSGVEMHNMEVVQPYDGSRASTVPYDFDFSGVVDARYAVPAPSLPIRNVKQRHFRGFCPEDVGRTREEYEAVFALFLEKKDEIYELWRTQEGLETDRAEDVLEYFDEFYETLSDPRQIDRRILSNCRRIQRRGESEE